MLRDWPELLPPLVACVALPAYMGLLAAPPWHFAAYIWFAALGMTAGEELTADFDAADDAALSMKLGFWLGATASLGAFPYSIARFALEYLS